MASFGFVFAMDETPPEALAAKSLLQETIQLVRIFWIFH
jgi:hypothetical protein